MLLTAIYHLSENYVYISLGINLLGFIFLLVIINKANQAPSTKVPWVMVVTLLPLGCVIYAIFGLHMVLSNRNRKKFHTLTNVVSRYYFEKNECIEELENLDYSLANQSRFSNSSIHSFFSK